MDEEARRPPREDEGSTLLAMAALGEEVVDHVLGLGATLALTPTRAVLIRQGAHFRPRNGVRSWPYGTLRDVQLAAPRHGHGRIVLRVGPYPWQAVSVFIDGPRWADAERVVAQVRTRAAQARRSIAADAQAQRPPSTDLEDDGDLAADPPDRDR